jgi:predicted phage-related endonuclease
VEGRCLATWKERSSARVSVETLKNLHPAIYNECLTKSTTRNFTLRAYA